MEIVFYIIPRLLFIILIQLMWDVLIHRDSKDLDVEIAKREKENEILTEECYNTRKTKEEFCILCPNTDCKHNLARVLYERRKS